jgi:O-antigen/teichoic acid export membrane protein
LPHTIRKRFAASLAANILRSGISFSTGMLLARWMGPEDYGRMAFLLASFLAVRQLLDMASSSAFFTFLSRGPRSQRFVSLYWRWVGIQFFVVVLVVGLLFPDEWIGGIWRGAAWSFWRSAPPSCRVPSGKLRRRWPKPSAKRFVCSG